MIKAEYVDHMGSDITVVNSARVSFDKESKWEVAHEDFREETSLSLSEKDSKLIRYLATHNHFTPFTHPQITLRETVPIFVARQRFKHVVGFTYNEVSRRYVDDSPEMFMPEHWRLRPEGSVKQGSEGIHPSSDFWKMAFQNHCDGAIVLYEDMLANGVAPEQARMVLPQAMMTSYYVTGSLAAFARLFRQRSDSHAQKEIQDLADQVGKIISPLYPVSWAALTEGAY